jgi:dihydroorotase
MNGFLIAGGRVIDPSRGTDGITDVYVVDGRIEAVGHNIAAPEGTRRIEATGKVVAPGLIDVHVHLREPGQEHMETIATGAMAAAAGGFTGICSMPNTDPVIDNQAAVGFVVRQAIRAGKARVYPIGCVSLGQKGQQLAEFGEMVGAGAVAVSDDGKPVVSSQLMRTALEYARTFGIPVADHCEDPTLSHGGVMHEGLVSTRLGLKGIPSAAEEIMVARDIILAELTGGHIHLCHMSTKGSVALIRRAKEMGLNVTAEATPHHFSLTHDRCEGYDTNAKMNPPLREEADREAIREGLRDGTIDCIATDHAPHHYDAKQREFDEAPNGIVGLETALGVGIRELVAPGHLTLPALIARMSTVPARVFRLPGGTLAVGAPADLVVFDPGRRWSVRADDLHSKSANSPYLGESLTGQADLTLVGGRIVFERGVAKADA